MNISIFRDHFSVDAHHSLVMIRSLRILNVCGARSLSRSCAVNAVASEDIKPSIPSLTTVRHPTESSSADMFAVVSLGGTQYKVTIVSTFL